MTEDPAALKRPFAAWRSRLESQLVGVSHMMKFRSYVRIFSLMLAISFAARSEAGTVTLFPPEVGGGFAEVTAGKSVTFDLTLTNGTDDPIFTPDPSTIANGINFDVGNMDLAVTGDAIVNNTCNLPMLGAAPCSFGLKVSTADLNPGVGGNFGDWFDRVGVLYDVETGVPPEMQQELIIYTVTVRVLAPPAAPEPTTFVLLIAGMAALFFVRGNFRPA
jgi:hypothetical protein